MSAPRNQTGSTPVEYYNEKDTTVSAAPSTDENSFEAPLPEKNTDEVVGNPSAAAVPPQTAVLVEKPDGTKAKPKIDYDGETGYLDGLRGIAMIMVFNEHFSTHTWTGSYPDVLSQYSAQSILVSKVGLILFFVLSGRLNVTSYFRRMGAGLPVNWTALPDALFRRTMRLAGLSIVAMFIQKAECAANAFGQTIAADAILKTESQTLWPPGWCSFTQDPVTHEVLDSWTSASQLGKAFLQIFTSFDSSSMLSQNSMLWSMPVQLWGMIFVLMLMPFLVYMAFSRRLVLYAILSICLGYSYSHYLPFLAGLICADVKATGQLRKFREWNRILYICVEVLLAGSFMIFLCYNQSIWVLVKKWAPTTYKEGVIGVDTTSDDFARQPTEIFRGFMLLLWLEMSYTMQWIVGNFLFKALGRVAFGFYLSQMSIQYLVIPPMTIYFNNKGNLWWDGITYTWLACFFLNWLVGWFLVRYVDDNFAKLAPWIIKNARTQGALGLAKTAVMDTWTGLTSTLPKWIISRPSALRQKMANGQQKAVNLKNWRSPAPMVPVPSDPSLCGLTFDDLYSTEFTADTSDDPTAVRTARLLRAWSYASPLNLLAVPFIAFVWMWWNPWIYDVTKDPATFSSLWRILWVGSLPMCIMSYIGYCIPDRTPTPAKQAEKPVYREHIHRLYIVGVTRGTNEEATRRAYAQLIKLEKYHPAVRVVCLTDEPNYYPDLNNVVCPKSHVSPGGLAKHKARALDYFRQHVQLNSYDHVLHMDEESTMDAESLRGCFNFLRHTPHHIGQGIITYNGHKYMKSWKSWIFGVADALRVGDDLGRFNLQGNAIHRPVFGIHGSFLMLSGDAENQVLWDYKSLVEDFEFSQAAWKKGFSLGRIHGIVREQSPETFRDFLKQRRRWFMGIRQISGKYPLPTVAIKLWTSGVFCLGATLVNFIFSPLISQSSTVPWWLHVISCFCFAGFEWLYVSGMLFSELDYGYEKKQWWKIPVHCVATVLLQPIAAVLEAGAVIWALASRDEDVGFEVVKK